MSFHGFRYVITDLHCWQSLRWKVSELNGVERISVSVYHIIDIIRQKLPSTASSSTVTVAN